MSFDLVVWNGPADISAEQAGEIYEALVSGKKHQLAVAGENVAAFLEELTDTPPGLDGLSDDEADESPWASDFDETDAHVIMNIVWSRSAGMARLIKRLATKHGLVCFDPQSGEAHLPGRKKSVRKKQKPDIKTESKKVKKEGPAPDLTPEEVVLGFIEKMAAWERKSWKTGRPDEARLAEIFAEFCTGGPHERLLYNRYGSRPDYDAKIQKVLGMEQLKTRALVRVDGSNIPNTRELIFSLVRKKGRWMIAKRESITQDGKKWKDEL